MKRKKLIFLFFILLGASSCNFLDVEPLDFYTTEQYYENDNQVEAAITSIYRTFIKITSDYGQQFNGNSDEAYVYNAPELSLQNFTHDATNKQITNFWNNLYAGVKNINFLLEGIEKNKNKLSDDVYRHAKGEALFLRGYFYFLLVQWYCNPAEGYGIPMPLEAITSFEDTRMPLVSMDNIYLQIEKDMTDAIPLLEDQTFASLGYSERVTIDAVYGILTRVCLYAAGFPNEGGSKGKEYYYREVINYGNKVTELGHKLVPDYCDLFKDECQNKYNSETIWEVGYNYNGNGSESADSNIGGCSAFGIRRDANDRNTGAAIYDSLVVQGAYRFVHPRVYNSYGEGDERRDWNCPQFSYTANTLVKVPKRLSTTSFTAGQDGVLPESKAWNISIGKWRREDEIRRASHDRSSNSTNFPLLRYADVLLMIAEAHIELGELPQVVPYINEVRQRAIDHPGADIVLDRIADVGGVNISGYTFTPKATINHGSGEGLQILVGHDTDNKGNVSITVLNPGHGYTTPPTITLEPKRVTWIPKTKVLKNQYFLADNLCLYKVFEDGTTSENYPEHKITNWNKQKDPAKNAKDIANDMMEGVAPNIPPYSNLADGPSISINSSANAITSDNYYLPIPQTQLTLNPNLKQNPGF